MSHTIQRRPHNRIFVLRFFLLIDLLGRVPLSRAQGSSRSGTRHSQTDVCLLQSGTSESHRPHPISLCTLPPLCGKPSSYPRLIPPSPPGRPRLDDIPGLRPSDPGPAWARREVDENRTAGRSGVLISMVNVPVCHMTS